MLHLILPKNEGSFVPFSAFLTKTVGSQLQSKCEDIADVLMPQSLIRSQYGDLIISAQSLSNPSPSLTKSYLERQSWYGSWRDVSGREDICSAVQNQAFTDLLEQKQAVYSRGMTQGSFGSSCDFFDCS
jgi:hypothetical protein